MTAVVCDYCRAAARLTTGREVYPHRPDLFAKPFYVCTPCDARVGCHPGTNNVLGRLANAELRGAKQAAHAALDPLWRSGQFKRKDAYYRLSKALGIAFADCHIGMFDVETCRRVVAVVPSIAADGR